MRPRIIPCLLLSDKGLVKTIKFKNPVYLGDPINVVKIFNDKEVDELIILDVLATIEDRRPDFEYLGEIATECFMPLTYGGGVTSLEDMKNLFSLGIEKISINSYAISNPQFVRSAAEKFGSQSIVVSIDVKKSLLRNRYEVYSKCGRDRAGLDQIQWAQMVEQLGAGEILLNSIERDGTMKGYDLESVKQVSQCVNIPVIACGGAGNVTDLAEVIKIGEASAAAAGSMFVFHGPHRAVLINFPSQNDLKNAFGGEVI